ncbi:hypothetical protein [Streptomyces sp. Ac-502]|uniref:hypothetical protein n=1 Tax=Streptomyces sp. Ac-502 TaxID=3342801 RepID=UPI0038627CB5
MAPADQWISTSAGRIATCPYSWMQAVHWVAGSGLYTPSRTHGPKWGPTTIAIAQEIAALAECRPGIAYLARKVKVSERTVKYHLGMLRETGLLAYRSKGTRITSAIRQASVYERVIPRPSTPPSASAPASRTVPPPTPAVRSASPRKAAR